MQCASSTNMALMYFFDDRCSIKSLWWPSMDSGLAKIMSISPSRMSDKVIFSTPSSTLDCNNKSFKYVALIPRFWRLLTWLRIKDDNGETTIITDFSDFCRNLKTNGAISNVRDLPLPVGEQKNTSFPLAYASITCFWFCRIFRSLHESFSNPNLSAQSSISIAHCSMLQWVILHTLHSVPAIFSYWSKTINLSLLVCFIKSHDGWWSTDRILVCCRCRVYKSLHFTSSGQLLSCMIALLKGHLQEIRNKNWM